MAGGVLRRVWPHLYGAVYGLYLATAILGKFAVDARLVDEAKAIWAGLAGGAVLLILTAIEKILKRLKLVDKSKAADPPLGEIVVTRPPPPINEDASRAESTPIARKTVGGPLPEAVCGPGRTASWRLEGDYDWRPGEVDAPAERSAT